MIIFDIIFEARIFEYGSYLSRVESHILRMGVDGFSSLFLRDMFVVLEVLLDKLKPNHRSF
jgi:hypothetical protein